MQQESSLQQMLELKVLSMKLWWDGDVGYEGRDVGRGSQVGNHRDLAKDP
jgi:hypothetical protein